MVAAASWLLACAGLVWFPNISAAGVPFGVPFGSGVPIGVPSTCHTIIIIGLGKQRDSGIVVPKSRTAMTRGNKDISPNQKDYILK